MDKKQTQTKVLKQFGSTVQHLDRSSFKKTSKLLNQALADSQLSGEIDPELVIHGKQVAEYCFAEGHYSSAASVLRVVMEFQTMLLGADHADVRESKRKLAQALWQTGGLSPNQLAANL